jgi:hypothetical protein
MNGRIKSWLAMLMGVIILVADLIWTYQSAYDAFWLALGIVILVADIVWLYIDYSFMKKAK